ncbi:uncharacterized protein LOC131207526 [Anopheles bellator]|uniref:uncharacterized protein LOC131207526 n=1 Tax=Anopheles bellator TaxID=139047 RepID=UPI00264722A8|nr:uncharacterized protein LOC131207526 [Anopheles bellator]
MDSFSSQKCRLCLGTKFHHVPMFPANEPVNDELLRKIRECASVAIVYEHDQTSVICIKCIVDVENFYSFRERCRQSDLLLRQNRQHGKGQLVNMMKAEENSFTMEEEDQESMLPELQDGTNTPARLDSFAGPSQLVRIGYNYRVVLVNDETSVLIYRRHRYHRLDRHSEDCKQWVCVASGTFGCTATLTVTSTASFPLALLSGEIKHNHDPAMVAQIGTLEDHPTSEQVVKEFPSYTLVIDLRHRLRLLASGYRYRLHRALFADGLSLWVCERRKLGSEGCPARVMLSYEDEKVFFAGDQPHNHQVEECAAPLTTLQSALMAQKKTKETTVRHGFNYTVMDDTILFAGNIYKTNKKSARAPWSCVRCQPPHIVRLRVKQKYAKHVSKAEHKHSPALEQRITGPASETLRHGANYRLVTDGTGRVWLVHRRKRYVFHAIHKNGTTDWVCEWGRMGCRSVLQMVPDEQIVYVVKADSSSTNHRHRVRNALEEHFPKDLCRPETEVLLWSCTDYDLLWNVRAHPIVRHKGERFYARKAKTNGTLEWHCTRGKETECSATLTIDKSGAVVAKSEKHDHEQLKSRGTKARNGLVPVGSEIFTSPGPVELLTGGFNYRRMLNVQLGVEIILFCGHKYLREDADIWYCILRDEPEACQAKITLTHNGLCAEHTIPHHHSSRDIRKIMQPERTAQVTVEGPNYEIIYAMTGRNCTIFHEGYAFRMYKMLGLQQSSRWRCIQSDYGCKAFLNVPLSLSKPASISGAVHDHSAEGVKLEPDDLCNVLVQQLDEDSICSVQLRPRSTSFTERKSGFSKIPPVSNRPLDPTVKEEDVTEIDSNGLTCFQNGQMYVRNTDETSTGCDMPPWICAFHWTLHCAANLEDHNTPIHSHERFAAVRTNDRFAMLKVLIVKGIIAQRGPITLMPEGTTVSEYELMPSNVNLSLIIDSHRYYFYKAKNNGEWVWRCVRHRWQGCKIGVAVSHCFGRYYFQPYGTTEHEHS